MALRSQLRTGMSSPRAGHIAALQTCPNGDCGETSAQTTPSPSESSTSSPSESPMSSPTPTTTPTPLPTPIPTPPPTPVPNGGSCSSHDNCDSASYCAFSSYTGWSAKCILCHCRDSLCIIIRDSMDRECPFKCHLTTPCGTRDHCSLGRFCMYEYRSMVIFCGNCDQCSSERSCCQGCSALPDGTQDIIVTRRVSGGTLTRCHGYEMRIVQSGGGPQSPSGIFCRFVNVNRNVTNVQ